MNIFDEAKERLNIAEVARFYGLTFKNKKVLCPFHGDTHPSMSFKHNYFTCFACGAKGSIIDLAQQILGLSSPLEAVKRLNADFGLGLKLDGKPDPKSIKLHKERVRLAKAFESWERETYIKLTAIHRLLLEYRRDFAPKSVDEPLKPEFIKSLQNLEYIGWLCETLRLGTLPEKVKIYQKMRETI